MSFRDNYNIAIVGLGNVGSEVYRHLVKNKRLIEKNTNSTYQIKYISAKNFIKKGKKKLKNCLRNQKVIDSFKHKLFFQKRHFINLKKKDKPFQKIHQNLKYLYLFR